MLSNYAKPLHNRLFQICILNLLLIGTPGIGNDIRVHQSFVTFCTILDDLHVSTTSADIAQRMMDTWADTAHSENEVIKHFSSFDLLVIDEYVPPLRC